MVSGKVEVSQNDQTICELVAGDYFGELALLEGGNSKRKATVKTLTNCTLMCCTSDAFKTILRIVPEFIEHFNNVKEKYNKMDLERNTE